MTVRMTLMKMLKMKMKATFQRKVRNRINIKYIFYGIFVSVHVWQIYSEHYQISKTECFTEIVNSFQPLTIFAKHSILGVWQGSVPRDICVRFLFKSFSLNEIELVFHNMNVVLGGTSESLYHFFYSSVCPSFFLVIWHALRLA